MSARHSSASWLRHASVWAPMWLWEIRSAAISSCHRGPCGSAGAGMVSTIFAGLAAWNESLRSGSMGEGIQQANPSPSPEDDDPALPFPGAAASLPRSRWRGGSSASWPDTMCHPCRPSASGGASPRAWERGSGGVDARALHRGGTSPSAAGDTPRPEAARAPPLHRARAFRQSSARPMAGSLARPVGLVRARLPDELSNGRDDARASSSFTELRHAELPKGQCPSFGP